MLRVASARTRNGDAHRGVDFGVNDRTTFDNGETIANPRFVRNGLPRMVQLQRQQARKKRGSVRHRRLGKQVARVHERIGTLRREFLHKVTSQLVASCVIIAMEELGTQNMIRSARGTLEKHGRRVKQEAGLIACTCARTADTRHNANKRSVGRPDRCAYARSWRGGETETAGRRSSTPRQSL